MGPRVEDMGGVWGCCEGGLRLWEPKAASFVGVRRLGEPVCFVVMEAAPSWLKPILPTSWRNREAKGSFHQ